MRTPNFFIAICFAAMLVSGCEKSTQERMEEAGKKAVQEYNDNLRRRLYNSLTPEAFESIKVRMDRSEVAEVMEKAGAGVECFGSEVESGTKDGVKYIVSEYVASDGGNTRKMIVRFEGPILTIVVSKQRSGF